MAKRKLHDGAVNHHRPLSQRGINPIMLALRRRRQDLVLSQEEVSTTIGYHIGTIRGAEIGEHQPSLAFVIDYANALGLEIRLCELNPS